MSWFPGWDSIVATSWWSGVFFWASIFCLIGLGITEVVSHRYAERKDELVERQQAEEKKKHDDEITAVHLEAAQVRERAAKLEKEAAEARLELARIATARHKLLTQEASETIVEKLKPFAGTKFDIGHASNGREQWDLLWVLEPLFAKAEWMFVDWVPGPLPHPGVFPKLNWTMQRRVYGVANVSNVSIELRTLRTITES
jgi:hypothetical protein